jgi:cysteinyl-tRNA synthetase
VPAPAEVVRLAEERDAARAAKDFATADALRDRIQEAGWSVIDGPGGWRLEQIADEPKGQRPVRSRDVASVLEEPPTHDVTLHWICEGWADDIQRAVDGFRAFEGGRRIQRVVADVAGEDPDRWGEDVEVLSLEAGTGWAAARNAGLRRTRGRVAVILDGSIEPAGDVLGPLERALADPGIGLCGPFGIVTADLRQFDEAPGPGPCDAVEGYLMALRRETLGIAGLFDEKFRWYRTADVEYSFRVKDAGLATVVVDVPVTRHEHRMWFHTDPAERAKWSKRNFYRFLDLWRDRWDLTVSGRPPEG